MLTLSQALSALPEIQDLLTRVQSPGDTLTPVALGGLSAVHQAHVVAAVRRLTGRPVAVLCPDEALAVRMQSDAAAFAQEEVRLLPAREWSFYPAEAVSREWEQARLDTLAALTAGQAGLVCGPVDAFLQRTLPPDALQKASLRLKPKLILPPDALVEALVLAGYRRCEQVEGVGQFVRRGGLVDFYSPGAAHPVRVEFFDDEIDTLSSVDPDSQRRIGPLADAPLLPVAEALPQASPGGLAGLLADMEALAARESARAGAPDTLALSVRQDMERLRDTGYLPDMDRYLPLLYPHMTTALDILPPGTVVFFTEYRRSLERLKNTLWRLGEDMESLLAEGRLSPEMTALCLDEPALLARLAKGPLVFLDSILPGRYEPAPRALHSLFAKQMSSYGGNLDVAMADMTACLDEGYAVVALCAGERQVGRLKDLLEGRDLSPVLDFALTQPPAPGRITLAVGALSGGLEYPALKLAVFTEGQLVAAPRRRRGLGKKDARAKLASYADLTPGDLVVHEHHGIGRFDGIVKMPVDGIDRDYIHIAYAAGDGLYVPVTQLHLVSKYIGGGEESAVRLHKLGGGEWQRAKTRARAAAQDLAQGLIKLYAERKRMPGCAFPADSDWQTQFEEAFEYVETDDQLRCAAEIKADMQAPAPMDRLLCGDVGFGKTEVALRAVMKCLLGGKQAALLAPTTVLAQQHYQTALRRFAGHPVRIGMCSRFVPPKQAADNLRKLASGEMDFIIGTHKLLQKTVKYKDLGLLIVDEEQRFGVTHKERLKEMARQVDVLTLTATPIPRTLGMALAGLRDMSTIEEPPRDRYPVQTYVLEHDWSILADALRREIQRGGQAYYLHNRVESIDATAARLARMLPGVSVAAAHGQMEEGALSDVMSRMADGEIQILVCTTIIETGLDIPNVNTLIIEDADRLGLAQLHQIRGRVGRSPRHAFAYMTYRRGKALTEVAAKRLTAIREFAEFGSGFKIAMRDLEIRGAGNVLGPEQHGHMLSVGYDMYLKLLEEAVLEAQGEPPPSRVDCTADLPVSAGIPETYIAAPGQRMDLYRRIAALRDGEDASDLLDELIDRFGDPPVPVTALVRIALLRAAAARLGISEIAQKTDPKKNQPLLIFTLAEVDLQRAAALCVHPEYKSRILFGAGKIPHLSLRLTSKHNTLQEAQTFVDTYKALTERNEE
ncbi:MAG: transcription-repair coupling factor [Oscillospiraceae bacterium]|jgi:transcription-repair coupling factor (superfamily II helicase)|nr:transcription-repair coupling factor [Oscillospiraceae bacterium]